MVRIRIRHCSALAEVCTVRGLLVASLFVVTGIWQWVEETGSDVRYDCVSIEVRQKFKAIYTQHNETVICNILGWCYGHDRRACILRTRPSCILHRSIMDTNVVYKTVVYVTDTTAARWRHTPTKLLPLTSPNPNTNAITLTVTLTLTLNPNPTLTLT